MGLFNLRYWETEWDEVGVFKFCTIAAREKVSELFLKPSVAWERGVYHSQGFV